MKLEVGMYVRTDDGYIAKYDNSKHNCSGKYYGFASTIRDMRWEEYDDDCFLWESELKNITKTSYNIIDLIEVEDYVNGKKVGYIDDCNGAMREYYYDYEDASIDAGHWFEEIKTIVTKEQLEAIQYAVK